MPLTIAPRKYSRLNYQRWNKVWFLTCILFIFSCSDHGHDHADLPSKLPEYLTKQKSYLVGKTVNSLLQFQKKEDLKQNNLLLLYNGFDCPSCVKNAFLFLNEIDNESSLHKIVVGVQASRGNDQITHKYSDHIYSDMKDVLRKELKFIKTPAIIHLDNGIQIQDIFYSDVSRNTTLEAAFLESLKD